MHRFAALKRLYTTRDIIVLAAIVLVVIVSYAHAALASTPQYTIPMGQPSSVTRTLFHNDIKEFGGKKAYARFSEAMKPIPEEMQHEYAHEFGAELYAIEGEDGITACDTRFHFGCFHQFMSESIARNGLDSIDRLYHKCGQVMGGLEICQHGLGHGILASIGYTDADLNKALEICKPIQGDIPLVRCDGGVFMEYNIHTIANVEGTPGIRLVENGDFFKPCDQVKPEFRNSCTFWLPQWWYALLPQSARDPNVPISSAPYQAIAKRCESSEYARTCYEGIGYVMIGASHFDALKARDICDSLGGTHHASLYCRSMAARMFKGAETVKGQSGVLCDGLSKNDHAFCVSYLADNDHFLPEMLSGTQE